MLSLDRALSTIALGEKFVVLDHLGQTDKKENFF